MSNNLKKIRDELGLTLEAFADKIGVELKTYDHWEKERRGIKKIYLQKISHMTGYSIDYILGNQSQSEVSEEKLLIAIEALEDKLGRKKISREKYCHYLAQIYNQIVRYEMQGETTPPRVIADLLIARGAG